MSEDVHILSEDDVRRIVREELQVMQTAPLTADTVDDHFDRAYPDEVQIGDVIDPVPDVGHTGPQVVTSVDNSDPAFTALELRDATPEEIAAQQPDPSTVPTVDTDTTAGSPTPIGDSTKSSIDPSTDPSSSIAPTPEPTNGDSLPATDAAQSTPAPTSDPASTVLPTPPAPAV